MPSQESAGRVGEIREDAVDGQPANAERQQRVERRKTLGKIVAAKCERMHGQSGVVGAFHQARGTDAAVTAAQLVKTIDPRADAVNRSGETAKSPAAAQLVIVGARLAPVRFSYELYEL